MGGLLPVLCGVGLSVVTATASSTASTPAPDDLLVAAIGVDPVDEDAAIIYLEPDIYRPGSRTA
jgi:hypothetical protein